MSNSAVPAVRRDWTRAGDCLLDGFNVNSLYESSLTKCFILTLLHRHKGDTKTSLSTEALLALLTLRRISLSLHQIQYRVSWAPEHLRKDGYILLLVSLHLTNSVGHCLPLVHHISDGDQNKARLPLSGFLSWQIDRLVFTQFVPV